MDPIGIHWMTVSEAGRLAKGKDGNDVRPL